MFICVSLFIVGLICLIKGGDWFVDGATGIARKFHLPELLIGATVVSIGTTLPEVMVSTTSALPSHSCPFWQPSCAFRRSAPDGPKRLGTAPTHKAAGQIGRASCRERV